VPSSADPADPFVLVCAPFPTPTARIDNAATVVAAAVAASNRERVREPAVGSGPASAGEAAPLSRDAECPLSACH
jgi:hypothetical protein